MQMDILLLVYQWGHRGSVKVIRLHKALAETFIDNSENLPLVHHKDTNKLNFNLSNLKWTTQKEHKKEHQKIMENKTPYYGNRKLTKEEVSYIKNNIDISSRKLAKKFNVSKTTISNVRNNVYYK